MKANETSLRNLLEGTKQFQIPLFQRPYSWEKPNWEALWEDLISVYTDEVKGFYFIGPIVTQAIPGTAEGISPFIVIDGQQRLTTLTILLAALRNCIKRSNERAAKELYNLYLVNEYKDDDEFYKVLPTHSDRETYKSIIQAKTNKDIKKIGKIYDAYQFFEKKLKKPGIENIDVFDYTKFKQVCLERLMLVNITSDEQDNPYLIFESLNNKGQELTQADLIRNYIFMQLPTQQQEVIYQKQWQPLQQQFETYGKEYSAEMTNAFWFYLRKDGESVSEKAVYKTLKDKFDKSGNIQENLEELIQFVKYYQYFNFEYPDCPVKFKTRFKRLLRLDFKAGQMFLLNVYHEYEQRDLSEKDFEKILIYVESYFVRRWFAGISTRSLGGVFNKLYSQVKAENPSSTLDGLYTVLNRFEGSQIWPDDESFCQGIINQKIYSKSYIDRVKLILESIEETLSKEKVDPDNLTIEHIMPQKLTQEWKEDLGKGYSTLHKKWLHTLGNLTLTGYNSELSNKSFEQKRIDLKQSNISLNKYFQNIETWNIDSIYSRAEYLAKIAIQVWPR
ncbi:MAG: DUF262 domain-containing HNH endonuclease family protein [Microcoleaceae cyanobacterium]